MLSKITACEMKNYHAVSEATIHSDEFNGVVLSGVPVNYSFDTIDERAEHFKWLRTTSLPVLGICLGHQSMGEVFGASVFHPEQSSFGDLLLTNFISITKRQVYKENFLVSSREALAFIKKQMP